MHQNCPVCFEFLFESVDPTTVLRCGHTIHSQCLRVSRASRASRTEACTAFRCWLRRASKDPCFGVAPPVPRRSTT
jgi:hypothetical protein